MISTQDWSKDVEEVIEPDSNQKPKLSTINYYFTVPTSIDNAIGESVGGDIALIAVAFIVICTFTCIALFIRDRVYNRTSLALLGIATVGLSISSGFGLSLYFGIPFTSLSQVRVSVLVLVLPMPLPSSSPLAPTWQ